MFMRLLLLFTLVPLAELFILLKLNKYIGLGYTFGIVILTGIVGAYLAKSQGRQIWFRLRYEMGEGRMPGDELINGLCVLVGGAMLLTPGILTDSLGFILVIPGTRELAKALIKRKLEQMMANGNNTIYFKRF
ncbi:FxsA family protein [Geosporobacter ferrireducens]|uniref:FxsA protein n=1 Tax=Geosporobacter ferrireducens TaxID=1424294 RepID=A0A1D8GLJ8_9FIRM|nr:FxsA family protein [Geosporobacter ferrireducens]AOT71787.1 FxsA protein [Geosporobacter ferrireducens]MTI55575.1 FxsA family protein [Geosporobacter ferrireducens]